MQINRIQNNNINFKGKFIENDALLKLKKRLTSEQTDVVEKCIKDVKEINDNKTFIYDSLTIGNKIISKIHIMDIYGNMIKQPLFIEFGQNQVSIFEQIANWYKNLIKI